MHATRIHSPTNKDHAAGTDRDDRDPIEPLRSDVRDVLEAEEHEIETRCGGGPGPRDVVRQRQRGPVQQHRDEDVALGGVRRESEPRERGRRVRGRTGGRRRRAARGTPGRGELGPDAPPRRGGRRRDDRAPAPHRPRSRRRHVLEDRVDRARRRRRRDDDGRVAAGQGRVQEPRHEPAQGPAARLHVHRRARQREVPRRVDEVHDVAGGRARGRKVARERQRGGGQRHRDQRDGRGGRDADGEGVGGQAVVQPHEREGAGGVREGVGHAVGGLQGLLHGHVHVEVPVLPQAAQEPEEGYASRPTGERWVRARENMRPFNCVKVSSANPTETTAASDNPPPPPRDVLEKGREGGLGGDLKVGRGLAGTPPPPRVPLWPPPKAGLKILSVNPLGAEATLWLSASNIGRGGGGEGGGSRGGGAPPAVYGRSNTSLPPPPPS